MSGRLQIIRIKENPARVRVRKRRAPRAQKQRTRIKTRRQAPARGYVVELVTFGNRSDARRAIGFAWWDGLKFNRDRSKAKSFSTTARALTVASRQMKKAKSDWYAARVVPG